MEEENASTSLSACSEPVFDIVCIPCESEGKHLEAEGYCLDCCEHLCAQCLKYHRTLLKQHELVDKDSMPMDQNLSIVKNKCTEVCSIHRDKVIEYYCPSHQVLGCSVCVTIKHKQCKDVAYIPELSADLEHSQEYTLFKQHLDQLIQKSDVIFSSAGQKLKTIDVLYSRVQRDINTFRKEINNALDELETEMKEKLKQIITTNTEGLAAVSREADRVKGELQTIATNFKELIIKKRNCQLFTQMKIKESDLLKLQETLEKIHDTDLQVCRFRHNEELLQLLKETDVLGKLSVRNTRQLRAVHVADINVRSKRNTETCRISGISVVTKEKLVVTDSLNGTVKLIDLVKNKMTCELQLKRFPWTVTAINNAKVAVTQPLRCEILFLTCADKLKVDTAVSVQDECRGIAYYQNKLIVTFDKPSKLEILSMTGEVLRRFETDDQGMQLLLNPNYISVDMEGSAIYVSEGGNNSLTMMSMEGKVLAECKTSELSSPGQCIIDQAGLVYLCGEKSHNIHVLTAECTPLKTVLTPKDGLWEPKAISYCENTGRLYVGMKYNDTIKAYQIYD